MTKKNETFDYEINGKTFYVNVDIEYGEDADEDGITMYRDWRLSFFFSEEHEGRTEEEVRNLIEDNVDTYIDESIEAERERYMDKYELYGVNRSDFY